MTTVPFPKYNTPILGQPLNVFGWTLVVHVHCQCDPRAPAVIMLTVKQNELGRNSDLSLCPKCGRAMHIAQLTMNAQHQLEFGVALGEVAPTPVGTTS